MLSHTSVLLCRPTSDRRLLPCASSARIDDDWSSIDSDLRSLSDTFSTCSTGSCERPLRLVMSLLGAITTVIAFGLPKADPITRLRRSPLGVVTVMPPAGCGSGYVIAENVPVGGTGRSSPPPPPPPPPPPSVDVGTDEYPSAAGAPPGHEDHLRRSEHAGKTTMKSTMETAMPTPPTTSCGSVSLEANTTKSLGHSLYTVVLSAQSTLRHVVWLSGYLTRAIASKCMLPSGSMSPGTRNVDDVNSSFW
mmetsp:Transcript_632/g.1849  ORF Transcript_632/g.1849 Transcript_632/m.1849 type:complete len:249 (-) Transcript_632:762-1508(-)